jgi:protein-tyrosine phosphatase
MFISHLIFAAVAVHAVPVWAVDDASVTRDGTTLTVRWTSSKPVDVILVDHADAPAKTGTLVSRADSDGSYFMTNAGTTRRYFILREAGKKRTLRTAERLVPLATGSNFRDIGGYRTASGKYVRWGMIYRSGATPVLSADDVAQVKALGLRDIFDLRSSEERIIAPCRTASSYTAIFLCSLRHSSRSSLMI